MYLNENKREQNNAHNENERNNVTRRRARKTTTKATRLHADNIGEVEIDSGCVRSGALLHGRRSRWRRWHRLLLLLLLLLRCLLIGCFVIDLLCLVTSRLVRCGRHLVAVYEPLA